MTKDSNTELILISGLIIVLFTLGRLLLKTTNVNSYETFLLWVIPMGVYSFIELYNLNTFDTFKNKLVQNPLIILSGILFLIGNYFFINAIVKTDKLSLMRTYMFGLEVSLLLFLYWLFYGKAVTICEILGIVVIFLGIYITTLDMKFIHLFS